MFVNNIPVNDAGIKQMANEFDLKPDDVDLVLGEPKKTRNNILKVLLNTGRDTNGFIGLLALTKPYTNYSIYVDSYLKGDRSQDTIDFVNKIKVNNQPVIPYLLNLQKEANKIFPNSNVVDMLFDHPMTLRTKKGHKVLAFLICPYMPDDIYNRIKKPALDMLTKFNKAAVTLSLLSGFHRYRMMTIPNFYNTNFKNAAPAFVWLDKVHLL